MAITDRGMDVAAQRGNKGNAKQDWLDVNDKMGLFSNLVSNGKTDAPTFLSPLGGGCRLFLSGLGRMKVANGAKRKKKKKSIRHALLVINEGPRDGLFRQRA